MTERRQYCPKGHDTFECGRDSSYRCLRCKRESGAAARRARRDAEMAVRDAERLRQEEEAAAADAVRDVVTNLPRLMPREPVERARRRGVAFGVHLCEWPPDGACDRRTYRIYCHRHMRQAEREAVRAAVEAVRGRWAVKPRL
jgi:hypothetical protein